MSRAAARRDALLTRLRTLRAVAPSDWGVLLEITALNLLIPLVLCVVPLRRVLTGARRQTVRPVGSPRPDAERLARLVECTAVRALGATCFTKAMVLARVLGRRGQATEVRLGARLAGGRLEAHAWVTREGTIVLGGPDPGCHATVWTGGAVPGSRGRSS